MSEVGLADPVGDTAGVLRRAGFTHLAAALGRPSSLRWFALYCPGCGQPTSRGADFLFKEARCKACGDVF